MTFRQWLNRIFIRTEFRLYRDNRDVMDGYTIRYFGDRFGRIE